MSTPIPPIDGPAVPTSDFTSNQWTEIGTLSDERVDIGHLAYARELMLERSRSPFHLFDPSSAASVELAMTEHEYLVSTDPVAMWTAISNRVSVDACKRFVLECQRRWRDLSFTPDADWKDTAGGLVVAISDFNHFRRTDLPALIREAFGNPWRRGHVLLAPADCSKRHIPDICCPICDGGLRYCTICRQGEVELDEPCFRFDVTAAIRERAIGIRDHDDWEELPLLADELEESGCQAVELLRHLRTAVEKCEECRGRGVVVGEGYDPMPRRERCDKCKGSGKLSPDPHSQACWALAAVIEGD